MPRRRRSAPPRARRSVWLRSDYVALFVGSDFSHNREALELVRRAADARTRTRRRAPDCRGCRGARARGAPRALADRASRRSRSAAAAPCGRCRAQSGRDGGGSNVKLPTYLGAGLAVVSTAFGLRGYAPLAPRVRGRRARRRSPTRLPPRPRGWARATSGAPPADSPPTRGARSASGSASTLATRVRAQHGAHARSGRSREDRDDRPEGDARHLRRHRAPRGRDRAPAGRARPRRERLLPALLHAGRRRLPRRAACCGGRASTPSTSTPPPTSRCARSSAARAATTSCTSTRSGRRCSRSLPRLTGTRTVVTVHGLDWQREKWGKVASWVLRHCEGPAAHFPEPHHRRVAHAARRTSASITARDRVHPERHAPAGSRAPARSRSSRSGSSPGSTCCSSAGWCPRRACTSCARRSAASRPT